MARIAGFHPAGPGSIPGMGNLFCLEKELHICCGPLRQSRSLEIDEVAEWLRRWTANPMCSARVGSNPILVANNKVLFSSWFSPSKFTQKKWKKGCFPAPGIEPGPAGWEPAILTTRPCRNQMGQCGPRIAPVSLKFENPDQSRRGKTFGHLLCPGGCWHIISQTWIWLMLSWQASTVLPGWPPWRNRLARSAVNRKVGGSSPPGGAPQFFFLHQYSSCLLGLPRHDSLAS